MIVIAVGREITHPIKSVWKVLADFGNMEWAEGCERVEVTGEGNGMIRRIYRQGMKPVDEILLSLDHAAKTYSYSVPDTQPLPLKDYVANVSVSRLPNGNTQVDWTSTALAGKGVDDDEATRIFEQACVDMLDALQAFLDK